MRLILITAWGFGIFFGALHAAQCNGIVEPVHLGEGKQAYFCFSYNGNDYLFDDYGNVVTKPEVIAAAVEVVNVYQMPKIKAAIETIKKELK